MTPGPGSNTPGDIRRESVLEAYGYRSSFNETAIHDQPIIYTEAEKVLPRHHWTHAEYLDYLSGLGVNFVVATPLKVDVLLARAAKFGWGAGEGVGVGNGRAGCWRSNVM
ncbi:hypothetical protein L202_07193 [Cryptococcus amylolentus CBS 6039]|uniref:Uncharacterized protein n=1 Tax=Cryptococcus amylolentus CBS 6039 TaxID=1295533 RepID=A0A1E3HHK3_9TREE|nr:hypothetical protein L202_07193 [Cryptococcus amylolentus CBS 6039]ODN74891.1 hypothetical protein L202_07193 [Cryptococcus amylolentus CBS 6039]